MKADTVIRPPWSVQQVANMNSFQHAHIMHPFTHGCLESANHPMLVALIDGWRCPMEMCDYTQDWAWAMMAERLWTADDVVDYLGLG